MTQSLFDPTGDETDRGGSRFLPPEARQSSHMPPDLIDGKVEDADAPVDPALVEAADEENAAGGSDGPPSATLP